MSDTFAAMAARLQREIPNAENRVDDSLIALSSLMTSVVTARRATGVPAKTGQRTILRLAKAQLSLVEVGGELLRAHGELAEIGKETAGYDLRECPPSALAEISSIAKAG
ncbi:hypothetical protein [Sphingopyxis sp. 113P3]|jgi:hypothetical protein|uniref:hypothetical protein n=1 Tax=Sphingopyxis sp. (strain 113P3) TaxID=292913 RepID=UPI0006BE0FAF|nr:hypothetical protein [Sphingopyxis sp. 113P3]ALC11438.1 hypothetical protein LH20_05665 [Sphingopyxis sp. 113P3]